MSANSDMRGIWSPLDGSVWRRQAKDAQDARDVMRKREFSLAMDAPTKDVYDLMELIDRISEPTGSS